MELSPEDYYDILMDKLYGAFVISSNYKIGSNAEEFHKELVGIYDDY